MDIMPAADIVGILGAVAALLGAAAQVIRAWRGRPPGDPDGA